MIDDPRYPIGQYCSTPYSNNLKEEWLADIRFLPTALEFAIAHLDEAQLHTKYRDGGWTVHQLVHHVSDSHMNAYCRFKLGYTENTPTICLYKEELWATTSDVRDLPVNISITLLFALHLRWHHFLTELTEDDWHKTVYHPEQKKELTLWFLLGLYAWHGRHHVAHITALRERMGW